MLIRRSQKKRNAEPAQKQNHRRLVIDPMVNPGSSAHRHQARPKADPTRPHHRMVTLAQSSPGDRPALAHQSKTTTVMLGSRGRNRPARMSALIGEAGMQPNNDIPFETALGQRVEDMLDACTRCGKCVEVCPSVKPAGIVDSSSEDIISGVLDIVRSGEGPEASRKWAASCMLSGECIKACDYGVNPRFLLAMARVAIAKTDNELPDRRRHGVTRFRDISRDVTVLSRLQLNGEVLERLGQKSASVSAPVEAPDFVFYT